MEIDIYALMEQTDFKRVLTIQKLHEITGKDIKECANMVAPFYETKNAISETLSLDENATTNTISEILYLILEEIREGNRKLGNIENSIQEIQDSGAYNSLADIRDKMDNL